MERHAINEQMEVLKSEVVSRHRGNREKAMTCSYLLDGEGRIVADDVNTAKLALANK
jgi:hypothetical protein